MVKPAIQPAQNANKPAQQASNIQPAGQTPMLGRLLTAQRPIGPRSSLFSHTIPPFYACYLLKSIQTPQTNFIYIGSTPSPPRRIRQHNGELTAGARKTSRKRPLVMQMIVYGFPSRLAALQFEWAWQHPHKSRHLRDETGNLFGSRKSYLMHKNIEIVQGMIARYPFTSWPLHVKLFTEEAVKFWEAAARKSKTPMPPGFIYSVELEGVDGKSGLVGSGRVGPMRADDDDFAAAIMVKHTALVASGKTPSCSICNEPLHTYATEPLHSTLCPTTGCTTTSHLTCLSRHFLTEQPDAPGLVPRGGHCKGCGEYTLWGDVVRGCYRRLPPRDTEQHPDVETDEMYESDEEEDDMLLKPKARKSSPVKKTRKRRASSLTTKKGKAKALGDGSLGTSSSGETFDFDNISSSSEDGNVPVTPKRRLGRPRKVDATMTTTPVPFLLPTDSSVTRTRLVNTTVRVNIPRESSPPVHHLGSPIKLGNDIEVFDLSNIASSSELESPSTPKRKRGRPPKNTAQSTSEQPSPSKKRHVLDTVPSTEVGDPDFSNIASNSEGVGAAVVGVEPKKRGPGRPRKNSGTTAVSSPLLSRASTKSRSHRLSPVANDSPPLSRLYHQHLASTSSNIPGAPSHARHGRNVHFLPRSPEHEPSHAAAPGSFDIESPGSFIWDQGRYHDQGNDTGGFQEDYGSGSGAMDYSPPRTPDRADRREGHRPSTPPSTTGGLTRAMAGLSTAGGTPSKVSSSRQKGSIPSIWNKGSIPVIEISD